ncbi:iron ABC transporter permease [Roseibacterium sp. SDUM158016]|uniref:lipocalin-like domain-containing protein n=1 Tax=Roseicyclus sediminis TaxID=2980997 RepID=UPI0021D1F989|nr:lipocalin-like domain-containing protein [Roseibacterium sp. SDUM158016]MCU4652233.1 iron ABC transporter permease [Roseibacterium sp. SDUM158016]
MRILALLLAFLAGPALSQGFAGLGTQAEGFAVPARDPVFDFPADHGAHPAYRIEWWYLTATLTGEDGQDYGVQWTLFRSALAPRTAPGWEAPQLWMGHAGLTTATQHFSAERLGRGGIGQAGVTAMPFEAWIDDWSMRSTARTGEDALSALSLTARGGEFSYALDLNATGPLVFHGDEGYSVKSAEGQASYYYSQPFYEVTGTLSLPGGEVAVTGNAWLDREWSSQPLSESQDGWDWFSLQFADGARMMGFGLRDRAGGVFTSATWIAPDGTETAYGDGALRLTPLALTEVAGRDVPTEWQVELPARGVDIVTRPLNPRSWMNTSFAYWEGPIRFEGSHAGRGYLEMTGYE